ncbi:hypothetical protein AB0M28_13595 [Streptomyces sp. NPDC051940]|uniref:hypothetical protein n=1 Tax=Streptomyces sp. NPDC051940 TaxID=3155675 RepID=UPI0034123E4A
MAGILSGLWTVTLVDTFAQDSSMLTELDDALIPPVADYWRLIESGDSSSSELVQRTILGVAVIAVVVFLFLGPLAIGLAVLNGWWWSPSRSSKIVRRCAPVNRVVRAVSQCADARRASWKNRPKELRALARRIELAEGAIMAFHRSSGHVPWRSHRRHVLVRHEGLVVAQLRHVESRIDSEGVQAIADVARLLMKIADRMAVGKAGALLDPEDIAPDLEPARDREPLRLAIAAVAIAAIAVGVSLLPLPDGAHVYVIGGCAVVGLVLVYGRRARNLLDLIATVRGA